MSIPQQTNIHMKHHVSHPKVTKVPRKKRRKGLKNILSPPWSKPANPFNIARTQTHHNMSSYLNIRPYKAEEELESY